VEHDAGQGDGTGFDAGRERWPFHDASVGQIESMHCLEHIADLTHAMREAQRVMAPGGHFMIRVPYGLSIAGMGDPTHVRPLYPWTFAAYMPGYAKSSFNPQHTHGGWPDGFLIDDMRLILARENSWMKGRIMKHVMPLVWMSTHLNDICNELWVMMHRISDADRHAIERGVVRVELAVGIMTEREAMEKAPGCAVRAMADQAAGG